MTPLEILELLAVAAIVVVAAVYVVSGMRASLAPRPAGEGHESGSCAGCSGGCSAPPPATLVQLRRHGGAGR